MVGWPIRWVYGDRICIIGPSGSGKTRLLTALMGQKSHVVLIDTKQDAKEHFERFGKPVTKITGLGAGRYIWKATDEFITDPREQSKVLLQLLKSGPRVVVFDEGGAIDPSKGAKLLATQGRGKRVSFIFGCQRPRNVVLYFLTDANFWIVFYLAHPDDRKVVEHVLGQKVPWDVLQREQYSFFIYNARGQCGGPFRLPPP